MGGSNSTSKRYRQLYLMHKTVHPVNPVFKNIVVASVWGRVARLRRASGKSIRTVEGTFHVYQLELEHQDSHNPAVHAGRGLDVRVL